MSVRILVEDIEMMYGHCETEEAAERLEKAINKLKKEGYKLCGDLKINNNKMIQVMEKGEKTSIKF